MRCSASGVLAGEVRLVDPGDESLDHLLFLRSHWRSFAGRRDLRIWKRNACERFGAMLTVYDGVAGPWVWSRAQIVPWFSGNRCRADGVRRRVLCGVRAREREL